MRREHSEGGLDQRAMSLVYTSLLALAPLLAVSFSVLKSFGVHNQLEPLLLEFLAPLGDKGREVAGTVIGFVESIGVGVLGMLGFAMLFYTVVSLIGKIEDNFNHIWRVTAARSLVRRFSDYLSVILVGPVLVFSALGLMASTASNAWVQRIVAIQPFGLFYYVLGLILPYLFIVATFTFVYLFIPNTRVQFRAALIAGLVAGLTWKVVGSLFASFVADSASYSAIYSGFAAVVLFMIWLYVSWLILLLGGVIAFHVQYPRYLGYTSRKPRLSARCIEELGVYLMMLIGKRQLGGELAPSLHQLADAVNLPWEPVAEVLQSLVDAQLIAVFEGHGGVYRLARDTDAITVSNILDAVRSAGDVTDLPFADVRCAGPGPRAGDASLRDLLRVEPAGDLPESGAQRSTP